MGTRIRYCNSRAPASPELYVTSQPPLAWQAALWFQKVSCRWVNMRHLVLTSVRKFRDGSHLLQEHATRLGVVVEEAG